MADVRKPVIAAVNGVVIGGAVEMLSNLDVVIAGESAKLSLPEAKRGVSAGGGGLPRFVFLIGRQKAAELLMTGRDIPSQEAKELGLVNMVVPDDEVEARALQMAKETAANAPDSVQLSLFGEYPHRGREWV
jgi:enoyl-CoA hydratase/carnithine racemase